MDDAIDPVWKQQIETALHAGYEFNARYAKYGVVWVWLAWLLKWGSALAALVAIGGSAWLLTTDSRESADWLLWFASTIPIGIAFAFFSFIHAGMKKAHDTEMKLAENYRDRHIG